jgi:peptide/nickel transport system permease protein
MPTLIRESTMREVGVFVPRRRSRLLSERRLTIGMILLGLFVSAGLLAPVLAPYDPLKQDYQMMLVAPGFPHLLGTDEFGRDILSRLMYGGRVSLVVAGAGVIIAGAVGVPLGLLGGYYGGMTAAVLMRLTDVAMAFPPILLAITVVALFGPGLTNLSVVIGVTYFPRFARLAYVASLAVRASLFVEAGRALGAGGPRLLRKHVLPNVMAPILVQVSLALGFGILLESGLSFLGLGAQPPTPSWGLMVADARQLMSQMPLYLMWPSLAVAGAILAFNLLGDGMRDASDPRLRV